MQALINEGRLKERIPHDILGQMIDRKVIHPYVTEKDFNALQHVGVFRQEAICEIYKILKLFSIERYGCVKPTLAKGDR